MGNMQNQIHWLPQYLILCDNYDIEVIKLSHHRNVVGMVALEELCPQETCSVPAQLLLSPENNQCAYCTIDIDTKTGYGRLQKNNKITSKQLQKQTFDIKYQFWLRN